MTDRKQLQAVLRTAAESEARRAELQEMLLAAERAIDEAVAAHQRAAGKIQSALAAGPSDQRREALQNDLDAANNALDSRCKALRARISTLQDQLMHAVINAPPCNKAVDELIATASKSLQDRRWHLLQEQTWLEARQNAARRSHANAERALATANGTANGTMRDEVARWKEELDAVRAANEATRIELEDLRQQMLEE